MNISSYIFVNDVPKIVREAIDESRAFIQTKQTKARWLAVGCIAVCCIPWCIPRYNEFTVKVYNNSGCCSDDYDLDADEKIYNQFYSQEIGNLYIPSNELEKMDAAQKEKAVLKQIEDIKAICDELPLFHTVFYRNIRDILKEHILTKLGVEFESRKMKCAEEQMNIKAPSTMTENEQKSLVETVQV